MSERKLAHIERIEEIKKHINRLREFLLNGTSGANGSTVVTPED